MRCSVSITRLDVSIATSIPDVVPRAEKSILMLYNLHGDRRHSEEIDGHRLAEMVVEECRPRLSRWPAKTSEDSRDSALGDRDAEHLQFAVNPRRTPQRIGGQHPLDQLANPCSRTGTGSTSRALKKVSAEGFLTAKLVAVARALLLPAELHSLSKS
jgi:hypothetical protein